MCSERVTKLGKLLFYYSRIYVHSFAVIHARQRLKYSANEWTKRKKSSPISLSLSVHMVKNLLQTFQNVQVIHSNKYSIFSFIWNCRMSLYRLWLKEQRKGKCKEIVCSYWVLDKLERDWSTDDRSNVSFLALISGQIVTVGNGIIDTDMSLSPESIFTGFSCQFVHTLRVSETHNQTDKASAIIHHNLFSVDWIYESCNVQLNEQLVKLN